MPCCPEAALEGAHRIWVGLRLLCPLGGSAIGEQHEGPNDLVAPLCLIDKTQPAVAQTPRWIPPSPLPPMRRQKGLCSIPDGGCHLPSENVRWCIPAPLLSALNG